MNYTRKVVCLKDYEEDGDLYWTAGEVYGAIKHKDGNWTIENNFNRSGSVGLSYLLDDFDDNFIDITKGASLEDAVRFAYLKGYFKVTDTYGYGCDGIHVEAGDNGFYAFGEEGDTFEGTAEEFEEKMGEIGISESIAKVIKDFIEDEVFPEEAMNYLLDMKKACESSLHHNAFEEVISEWIDKAEKVIEKEEER